MHDDSASGDTEILSSDNECDDSQHQASPSSTTANPSTPASTPEAAKSHKDRVESLPVKLRRALMKSVFGKHLSREECVDVLKKKFLVKGNSLTSLTPSQVVSTIIRKLISQKYIEFKKAPEQVTSIDDITVLKEISLL